ncbi:MAG: hypothetical protein WD533_06710 [Dehalococcoidia bacterium]
MQDNNAQPNPEAGQGNLGKIQKRAASIEILGEIILLLGVGAFFLYMFILSLDWTLGAALTPRIAIVMGTPFLILRIIYVVRTGLWMRKEGEGATKTQIMDVGFRVGDDPAAELRRFIRICVAIAILYLGIWFVGFHIMIPLWLFGYMYIYGSRDPFKRIFWAVFMAAGFYGLIAGAYDYFMRTPWHDPLLFQLFSGG